MYPVELQPLYNAEIYRILYNYVIFEPLLNGNIFFIFSICVEFLRMVDNWNCIVELGVRFGFLRLSQIARMEAGVTRLSCPFP